MCNVYAYLLAPRNCVIKEFPTSFSRLSTAAIAADYAVTVLRPALSGNVPSSSFHFMNRRFLFFNSWPWDLLSDSLMIDSLSVCNRPDNPSIGNRWIRIWMTYFTNRLIDGVWDLSGFKNEIVLDSSHLFPAITIILCSSHSLHTTCVRKSVPRIRRSRYSIFLSSLLRGLHTSLDELSQFLYQRTA